MDKTEFKKFCKAELYKRGFVKSKNGYYLISNVLICSFFLEKSNFGNYYYIDFNFIFDEIFKDGKYPTKYDYDVYGRFNIDVEYEKYTYEELSVIFEEEFNRLITPVLIKGKKYVLENFGILYDAGIKRDEVLIKLKS